MAKSKKKPVKLLKSSLVTLTQGIATSASVNVVFKSGIGQLTAILFRNGILINTQTISTDGNIIFADVQSGDTISIHGICTGQATVTINVPTNPPTPEIFNQEIIIAGYIVN